LSTVRRPSCGKVCGNAARHVNVQSRVHRYLPTGCRTRSDRVSDTARTASTCTARVSGPLVRSSDNCAAPAGSPLRVSDPYAHPAARTADPSDRKRTTDTGAIPLSGPPVGMSDRTTSPDRSPRKNPWAGPVPVCPVRSVHRDGGVERRRRPSHILGGRTASMPAKQTPLVRMKGVPQVRPGSPRGHITLLPC
jgi:hypothetical protein